MRIALDARTIYRPNRRGTGKNLLDLYTAVARLRPDWTILAYHRCNDATIQGLPLMPNIQARCIEIPGDRWRTWENLRLPLTAWRDGADLLHCPANQCPRWRMLPIMTTIHDLIPLDLPENYPPVEVAHFVKDVAQACRQSWRIICPSAYTRDRLVEGYDVSPLAISVIPWAPDSQMRRWEHHQYSPILDSFHVTKPYVLHLGAPDRRKNTAAVVQAWAMLEPAIRRTWQLLVIGLDEPTQNQLADLVAHTDLADSIRLEGFASENQLQALFSGATMLAYPSLSEGFGLPLLDAWSIDCPVLTSNTTSLPEVAQDAALLVDPHDPKAIAQGIHQLLTNDAIRQQFVQRGQQRVKQYTWQQTAGQFIQAAEQALADSQSNRRSA